MTCKEWFRNAYPRKDTIEMQILLNVDELGEIRNNILGSQRFRRIPGGPKDFHRARHFTFFDLAVARNTGQDLLRPRQAISGPIEAMTK
jgi:hypothetical protein